MHRDTRGTVITEGAQCAFNWSGAVVRGEVTKVNAKTIKVRHTAGHRKGAESTIRNPQSILVLMDGES